MAEVEEEEEEDGVRGDVDEIRRRWRRSTGTKCGSTGDGDGSRRESQIVAIWRWYARERNDQRPGPHAG